MRNIVPVGAHRDFQTNRLRARDHRNWRARRRSRWTEDLQESQPKGVWFDNRKRGQHIVKLASSRNVFFVVCVDLGIKRPSAALEAYSFH